MYYSAVIFGPEQEGPMDEAEPGRSALALPRGLSRFSAGPLEEYRRSVAALMREARRAVSPEGMGTTDLRALYVTGAHPSRPSALARTLGLSPAAATQLIDRLERRGFVRRAPHPNDRRGTVLTVTPRGRTAYRAASRRVERLFRELTDEMSPEGLAALRTGAREVAEILARRSSRAAA